MDEEKELLSVIVPIYNAEPYLNQCLDSIINQRYRKLEIILVDDGSTDHSGEIADSYQGDARVKVLHIENKGPFQARWEGVRNAPENMLRLLIRMTGSRKICMRI